MVVKQWEIFVGYTASALDVIATLPISLTIAKSVSGNQRRQVPDNIRTNYSPTSQRVIIRAPDLVAEAEVPPFLQKTAEDTVRPQLDRILEAVVQHAEYSFLLRHLA